MDSFLMTTLFTVKDCGCPPVDPLYTVPILDVPATRRLSTCFFMWTGPSKFYSVFWFLIALVFVVFVVVFTGELWKLGFVCFLIEP